jgi:hypothetical protein
MRPRRPEKHAPMLADRLVACGRSAAVLRALALGLAGGIVALLAISRRGERAVTVYAALLPCLNALVFLLGSLLLGS